MVNVGLKRSVWYLDLVKVLASLKRNHVVGGDTDDGFVCRVFGSIKSQRGFTRDQLSQRHMQTTQMRQLKCDVSVSSEGGAVRT